MRLLLLAMLLSIAIPVKAEHLYDVGVVKKLVCDHKSDFPTNNVVYTDRSRYFVNTCPYFVVGEKVMIRKEIHSEELCQITGYHNGVRQICVGVMHVDNVPYSPFIR